jgi:hypothetical protein
MPYGFYRFFKLVTYALRMRKGITTPKTILFFLAAPLWLAPIPIGKEGLPVIAAPVSPVKVRPVEEGGMDIPYQGIIVMNPSLSAGADKTEGLMAGPEEPLGLVRSTFGSEIQ